MDWNGEGVSLHVVRVRRLNEESGVEVEYFLLCNGEKEYYLMQYKKTLYRIANKDKQVTLWEHKKEKNILTLEEVRALEYVVREEAMKNARIQNMIQNTNPIVLDAEQEAIYRKKEEQIKQRKEYIKNRIKALKNSIEKNKKIERDIGQSSHFEKREAEMKNEIKQLEKEWEELKNIKRNGENRTKKNNC